MGNICSKVYNNAKEKKYGNYSIGNLYVSKVSDKTKLEQSSCEKVFDTSTFNYHLYPADNKCENYIADNVKKLRTKIIEKINNNYKIQNKWNLNARKGASARVSPVFKHVCVETKMAVYNINFMRFYISKEENSVNCILASIQFDCCYNGKFVNQTRDGLFHICYPTSYKGQEKELSKIVKNSKNYNFCYNPPINFSLAELANKESFEKIVELICYEFKIFVDYCEESI